MLLPVALAAKTGKPGDLREACRLVEAAILSALIDADAAATERAAKVAEADDGLPTPRKWSDDYVPRVSDRIAVAIRNQEPTDADA